MRPSDPIAALRGGLGPEAVGMRAREVAVWIDTTCQRARALGAVGSSGRGFKVAVIGGEETGTSPFATEAGGRHEHLVTRDEEGRKGPAERKGALARRLYEQIGVVVPEDRVREFDTRIPDGLPKDEQARARKDQDRVQADETEAVLADPGGRPLLLLQSRLRFRMAGANHIVKPDLLLWTGGVWRVGEMKAYLDRGGYTDGAAIAKAVKQCAVGVVALGRHVGEALVSAEVDLVLRQPGKIPASLRSLPAEAEIEAVRWADAHAEDEAADYLEMTGGRAIDTEDVLRAIPHEYGPGCHGSCGLADSCQAEAADRRADRLGASPFAHVGVSNQRAVELAGGAEPVSPSEKALAAVLRDGWTSAAVS